jgi:hypothetical protein
MVFESLQLAVAVIAGLATIRQSVSSADVCAAQLTLTRLWRAVIVELIEVRDLYLAIRHFIASV